MRKYYLLVVATVLFGLAIASQSMIQAQTDTLVPTVAGPTNDIDIFFVTCDDEAVVNFTGSALAGWDVYYQVFDLFGGQGEPLTAQRRVIVDGDFAFSEVVPYINDRTVGAGSSASLRVLIARETNVDSIDFETTVDDVQDGCASPQNPTGESLDIGQPTPTPVNPPILAPGGGVLNPQITPTPQPVVVIGPRETPAPGRSNTPGLVFAECDDYSPQADPGLIYDSDNVTVFWSWFARTPELLEDHANNSRYSITMNTAPFPFVVRSDPTFRDGNWWYFYTVPLGNLEPGGYTIQFKLEWDQTISDGYQEFGPNTDNVITQTSCNFNVVQNPFGIQGIPYNGQFRSQK